MRITTFQKAGIAIVVPPRHLIGEAVPALRQALLTEIDTSRVPRILIDFGQVRKMDSSGLGTLVSAYGMAKSKRGRIGVIHVGKNIKNLIVRSRLINFFEHFESEAAAMAALHLAGKA